MRKNLFIFVLLLLFSGLITVYAEDVAEQRIDSSLRTIWNEMVARLSVGDIEGALEYFTYASRGRYREQFTSIRERLPALSSGMRDIEMVFIKGDEAKYRIKLKDRGGERTGYIWFRKDIFGRWKIEKF